MGLFLDQNATALSNSIQTDIARVVAKLKEAVKDRQISAAELWDLLLAAMTAIITLIETAGQYDGATKKTVVLDAIGTIYDEVFASVVVPDWGMLAAMALKPLFMSLADKTIDAMVSIFKFNWGLPIPLPTPLPPTTPVPGPVPVIPVLPPVPDGFQPY